MQIHHLRVFRKQIREKKKKNGNRHINRQTNKKETKIP